MVPQETEIAFLYGVEDTLSKNIHAAERIDFAPRFPRHISRIKSWL